MCCVLHQDSAQCSLSALSALTLSKMISRPVIFSAVIRARSHSRGHKVSAQSELCKPRPGVRSLVVWVAETRRRRTNFSRPRHTDTCLNTGYWFGAPLGKCDHLLVSSDHRNILLRRSLALSTFYRLINRTEAS